MMKVDASKAVCDGAVLLSDYYDIVPAAKRERVAFVPHVNTTWAIGRGLREICGELGLAYVSPDLPRDEFVREISRSDLVLTEAMHGAILADARSEEHTSELQSLMRTSYAVFCLKKKNKHQSLIQS